MGLGRGARRTSSGSVLLTALEKFRFRAHEIAGRLDYCLLLPLHGVI